MKSLRISVILLALILMAASVRADGRFLSGVIKAEGGRPISALEINGEDQVRGMLDGVRIRIPFAKLKKIRNLGHGVALVVNLDGEEFKLDKVRAGNKDGLIYYKFFNEVSKETQSGRLAFENVESIDFGQDVGQVKMNPKTGKYYPADYLFDPYTGEKLVWGD